MANLLAFLVALRLLATVRAGALKRAGLAKNVPYSGAPFQIDLPLLPQPDGAEDGESAEMRVYRLARSASSEKDSASPHACDLGDEADRDKCMDVEGRSCMWTRIESRDPLKRIQASNSYCLPCRLDGQAIPCWNVGAWVGGKQVTHCQMNCNHQQVLAQPQYVCSDDTGFISQSQCFSKGAETGSKCMFIAFEVNGERKGSCAPCELQGSGGWGCPTPGGEGPEAGSKVISCLSQCDVLCAGPPACPPTVAPPPPPPPPAPGVVGVSTPADEMLSAPAPMAIPTLNPFSIIEAARDAALKAGFSTATTGMPKTYWPIVYYRAPGDFLFSTGPPLPSGPEPPLPLSYATASLLESKKAAVVGQKSTASSLLRRFRQQPVGA